MSQMQNGKKRNLYFPMRITEAMGKIFDHPLTLVEAPMGYGKTTAVREHVIPTDANLLWLNIYDSSKAAFWGGFCLLFEEHDRSRAQSLAQLGFPDDSVSMYAALTLIKSIAMPKQTVVVIDDFHLVDTKEAAGFIAFLAMNSITNLFIVLVSRFFEHFNIEELSLKGYIYHIKKESFEFSQNEIIEYYGLCGIDLTADEADELYGLTEGWISALYLLMLNFRESGSLMTSANIYELIGRTVYNSFPDSTKNFLLSMSIYDSFTTEQARYITPGVRVDEIIDEVTGKNAFVTYDFIKNTYNIHSIFKNFLTNKLELTGGSFSRENHQKAAIWYMQTGDYLLSMRYAYLGGDFDTLLAALELDRGHSINGEHKDLLIKYFDGCSMETKVKHPYAVLIFARRMFMNNEISLFKENCELFMAIYQNIEAGNTEDKYNLLGEYELQMSFGEYNDIMAMSARHKLAAELLKESSSILDKQSSWTYGSPSVLYLFYRKSGELSKEVSTMQEVMPYYNKITGNHGKGAGEIMSAERFYYMGDFLNAEIAMHKAYQAAEDTSDIVLCVTFLDVKLRFIRGDFTGITALFKKLHDNIFEKKWHIFLHTIDICEAYIFSRLQMNENVAAWVKDGEFQSTRLLFPSLAYLNIVYGRVLLESGEYAKLLGMAEEFLRMARVYPNLLAQIYTYVYVAAACMRVSKEDDAISALVKALDIASPDRVYMPFAENGVAIKPLLDEFQVHGMYPDDIPAILALCDEYHSAAERMIRNNSTPGKAALTEREREIARLAAHGLSNKEIGKNLYISENTVKTQLKSVFRKLGINSRSLLSQALDD